MAVYTSPVAKFPGEIVLPDYLTMPQCLVWSRSVAAWVEAKNTGLRDALDAAIIPGILACVSEWHIQGFPSPLTVENFPGSPRAESAQVIAWLSEKISILYRGEEVPNE